MTAFSHLPPLHAQNLETRTPADPGFQSASIASPAFGTGGIFRYSLSANGVLTVTDAATGQKRTANETLPVKVAYPFTPDLRDPIFSYGEDSNNSSRIAVTTARGISLSTDAGRSWTEIPTDKGISPNIHFTSVAVSPFSPNGFLAGTSFDGMYETTDGGRTWKSLTEKAGILGKGSGFYEEVSALSYDPGNPGTLYLAAGFGGGLYRYERKTGRWSPVELPKEAAGATVRHLRFILPGAALFTNPAPVLVAETGEARFFYRAAENTWERVEAAETADTGSIPADADAGVAAQEKAARKARAEGKTGIYLSAEQARGTKIDVHLKFIADHGMNSLVVDFKDDFGYITYDTALDLPKKAGAVNTRFKASELIRKVHEKGFYLTARIVVFKDRQLYRHDGNRYALWDRYANRAWGDLKTVTDAETGETRQEQLEFWVDPYAEEVWNYNIAIAEELQALGVDEIQFDYIRFPSDGDTSRITSRFQKSGMTRVNALESFLARARAALRIPLGTDVYGFNAWFRMKYIGQDIEVFSRYVDVISPMFYPSHFPREFLGSMQYFPRAEYIYRVGTDRAVSITRNGCVIRPYIQSFLIGGELKFEKPAYTEYLTRQLDGVSASTGSGFTLWNASGRYYMVTPDIRKFSGSTENSRLME